MSNPVFIDIAVPDQVIIHYGAKVELFGVIMVYSTTQRIVRVNTYIKFNPQRAAFRARAVTTTS